MPRTTSVTASTTFLHGTQRYEEGKSYDVSSEEAAYFKAHGWVEGGIAIDGGQDVTLDIEPAKVGTKAQEV